MKKKILGICVLIVSILLAGTVAYDSHAGEIKRKARRGSTDPNSRLIRNTVTAAGTFSGSLRGQIRVGDREFVITKNTRIYKAGEGLVDSGRQFSNVAIYVSGVEKKNVSYAKIVIVNDKHDSGDPGGAGELEPDEAR